jgi:hypothetical protein
VALLAKGRQVERIAILRPLVEDVSAGQHDLCACDRVWLVVLGETPLAFIASSLVSDVCADLLPIRRIAQAVRFTDRHL